MESNQEEKVDVWQRHKEKVNQKIIACLRQRPHTISELAKELGMSFESIAGYVLSNESIERITGEKERPAWFAIKDYKYPIDLENDSIDKIPEIWFFSIPKIKRWNEYVQTLGRGQRDDLLTFRNICYGRVVRDWKINPQKWIHPDTTKAFKTTYEREFRMPFKPHIVDSLRTFLQLCHNITLSKYDSAIFGLKVRNIDSGKYKYLKLAKEEFDNAERWMESEDCIKLCQEEKIRHSAALGHYAIAISSFGRPSPVLSLETRAIESQDYKGRNALYFLLRETKQGKLFPKYVLEEKLVKWATAYWQERLLGETKWKYLFLTDIEELTEVRKRYNVLYKALFKHLQKEEKIWYEDSLYCLRHIGIQRIIATYGFKAIAMLQMMGFPHAKTLFDNYGAVSPEDFLAAAAESR